MASRIYFISNPNGHPIFKEEEIQFQYFNGYAISQKQKSIKSMHEGIGKIDKSLRILEISTKSLSALGVALSAFNLKYLNEVNGKEYPLENIFQSSKVFDMGGPFRDLLNVYPKEAKRDPRLKSSGNLIHFNLNEDIWDIEPKTMFYDWIYMKSLSRYSDLSKEVLDYDAFTDIEFNHKKSINCQARSVTIFVSLSKSGKLQEVLNNKDELKKIYTPRGNTSIQMSLF